MAITSLATEKLFSYGEITGHCKEQIAQLAVEASRHSAPDAENRKERAYGVYMAWRSLVMQKAHANEFMRDDALMESMVRGIPGAARER